MKVRPWACLDRTSVAVQLGPQLAFEEDSDEDSADEDSADDEGVPVNLTAFLGWLGQQGDISMALTTRRKHLVRRVTMALADTSEASGEEDNAEPNDLYEM